MATPNNTTTTASLPNDTASTVSGMDAESTAAMQLKMQQQMQAEAFKSVMESCPGKTVASSVAGFFLGGAFGLFMSGMNTHITEDFYKLSGKDQIKLTLKDMGNSAFSSAKNLAVVGAVFSASECVIESFRAKHDIYNPLMSGCFAGAAMSSRAGPQAMAVGCAGFAAFSTAIELWMAQSEH